MHFKVNTEVRHTSEKDKSVYPRDEEEMATEKEKAKHSTVCQAGTTALNSTVRLKETHNSWCKEEGHDREGREGLK